MASLNFRLQLRPERSSGVELDQTTLAVWLEIAAWHSAS